MPTAIANINHTWDYKLPGGCLVHEDMEFRCSVEARYEGDEYYDFEFTGIEVSLFNVETNEWIWLSLPEEWLPAFKRYMDTDDMVFRLVEWLSEAREEAA